MLYLAIAASMALVSARSPTTTADDNGYSESSEPTICYGDDECRGRQVCDMGSYICVDPTPSPETPAPTDAPGCCYSSDSYKANDRCLAATDRDRCEDMGCTFMETDDPNDCVMTTTETPTTTAEAGCCKGDSHQTNAMCNERPTRDQCERSSSCHFIQDGVLDKDCAFGTTEPPEEPGCCYVNPAGAYTKRWQDTCTSYFTERECLFQVDESGMTRCVFELMNEYMDCEALWPTTTETPTEPAGCCYGDDYKQNGRCEKATSRARCEDMGCHFLVTDDPKDCVMTTTESPTTTEEVGCCKGDSSKTNAMCNSRPNRAQCERSSSCAFILNGVLEEDCFFDVHTEPPVEPGCCYGNPDIAYSKRWMEQCKTFGFETECLMLEDGDGNKRCVFEPMNEYMDCEAVWPTTTESPTEPAGCCYGDSYKQNDRCAKATTRSRCEDMGCSFLVTDDPSDCEMTTTDSPTTTATPGCCKGDSLTSKDKCNAIEDKDKCNARSMCEFIDFGILEIDCNWEVHTDPPSEPGCCYGNPDIAYSKRWMDQCKTFGTEAECLMLTNGDGEPRCTFEPLGEYEDCETVWPTTTTTTEEVGCCYGDSYKANDKCARATDRSRCESMGCSFLVTDDPSECEMTTTSSPTTTETPGCCAHSNFMANEKCNSIEDKDQCNRRSSCHFIDFGVLEIDCVWDVHTDPPAEPGCCYGNPDIAYSKRWMDQCKTFGTEEECLMLKNDDGEPRCYFEPLGEYEDCETVWPTTTTTTEEVGCCHGDSYKANDKCARATDRARCEDMGCTFLVTDDPSDFEMTTTSSPTTTEELGCCYGEGVKENEMCANKIGREQCERSDKCEFREGADADCEFVPTTTTSSPWLLPTTTSSWLGAKDEEALLLFAGENSVVSEAMNTQISLSTLILLAVVALTAQQLYKWWANSRSNDGYTKLAEGTQAHTTYQSA